MITSTKVLPGGACPNPANGAARGRLQTILQLSLALLIAAVAVVTPSLLACTHPPPSPPTVILMPLPNNCVKVIVCNYSTFGAATNNFCACALKRVGPIVAIKSFEVFIERPGLDPVPLPGFNFTPSTATAAYFNNTQGGNWGGFFSSVTQNIEPQIPLKLVFTVQTAIGSTLEDLSTALANSGPIIGTGEGGPQGVPTGGHLAVLPSGPITIMQPPGPVITDFFPQSGGQGTVITIVGSGFGQNANNICAIIMDGPRSLPLQVLATTDTQITATLGAVPPDAQPGPIMIALGTGNVGFFKPLFPDVMLREPSWVWVREPNGPEAGSMGKFNPIPGTINPAGTPGGQPQWFFSGPPVDGKICLVISNAWPNPSKVRVQGRAHDHEKGIGRDLEAYCIEFPTGGSILDCAWRICDTLRCAFMQQSMGTVFINCTVEAIPNNPNAVKITMSMPDGRIGWGNLNVCVEPAPAPPGPVITGTSTNSGCPGDTIYIFGNGFGNNPDNVCAVIMLPDGRSIPLQVTMASDTRICAILGQVPEDLPPGTVGQVMIAMGDGNVGTFMPAFDDVVVRMPVWAWNRNGPVATGQVAFTPIPKPPAPPVCWFFSGPPVDGQLCVILNKPWPAHSKVRIEARAHDHQRGIGRDLRAICIEIGQPVLPGSTAPAVVPPLECAYRICDVIRCAFQQQAGIDVECVVTTDPDNGSVKLTLRMSDGRIDWGNFNICFEPVPRPMPPVITSVDPPQGCPGDVITIRGTGFGNCPDNLCVVVMNGTFNNGVSIPLQAIKATDTEIQAVLGQVHPGAQPGPIMVGLGEGQFGKFRPAFFDIFVGDDVWTWQATGGAGMSPGIFTPIPKPLTPVSTGGTQPQWFFSGPPVDGKICLILTNNWPRPAKLTVQARAHDHQRGIGRDLHAFDITLEGGGTTYDCARRICDVIRCAFMQQGNIAVDCTVEQLANGGVKITLSMPDGVIGWGNLNVCVEKGPEKPAPVITSVTPAQGGDGTMVTIKGQNFGNNPDNVCAVVMSGNESVPLHVLEATDTQIKAMVGAVRSNTPPGQIMIGLGEGRQGTFTPALSNIVVRKPVWVWNRNGGPAGNGPDFRPIPNQANATNAWFFSGPPTNGMLMVTINGNWPSNALLRIEARAHDHQRRIGHDLRAICIQFPGGGTLQQCAAQICDVIRCAFQQQAGIIVNCTIQQLANGIKLTLTIPGGQINWGNFNICVSAPPPTPLPAIFSFSPTAASPGAIVTVRGTNFPTDPNDVCMVHMGPPGTPTATQSTPFDVISSSATQIVARLGAVPANALPGPIMVGIGEGQVGQPVFAFFDVFAELPVWTWERTGEAAQTPANQNFRPLPVQPPPTTNWFFSGPPVNGKLCLTLMGNWPRPAKLEIQARAHNHQKKIGRDLRAICIRLDGGGTIIDCAKRICDVLRCAFFQQGGFEINCTVDPIVNTATGEIIGAKLTLSLPEGNIDWGNFNVCVSPIVTPAPVITNVTPLTGGEGTIIRVRGTNFPTDPNDICLVVMSGSESIPVTVLGVTPVEVIGRVGAVRPGAPPGPVMVGIGEGARGTFRPAFFDIFVEEPVWVWEKTGPAGMGQQNFTPTPTPPPPASQWFFSGPPTPDGKICLTLTGNWAAGAKIRIQARAHDHQRGIGRDLEAYCIRFTANGTLLDCAKRICDTIRCAFFQQAGLAVNCTVEEITDGTGLPAVKLTLTLPDGVIGWGNLNVCVDNQPPPPDPIVINTVQPANGVEGDIITIVGTGFGQNPDNVCAVVMNGACSIPMRVLTATDTQITARLGAVPPDAQPGQIMVGLGQGNTGRFRPAFFDVFVADDVWTWDRRASPAALAPGTFRPQPSAPPPYTRWFFGEKPTNGLLCVYLHGNWPDPAKVRIEARAHDHQTGIGHDLQALCVKWGSYRILGADGRPQTIKMDLLTCAQRVCDTIVCAFRQQSGIVVNCEIITIDRDTVKIVLSLPGGQISWGNFNVCVSPCEDDPGPVIEIARPPFSPVVPVVRLCWPLSRTGYCVRAVDALGDVLDWQPATEALTVEGTMIKVPIPIDRPQRFFQLYQEPLLLTNPD